MNYKYRTSDAAFVLSEDEHNKILDQMKEGRNIIVLREGNLILNTKYIKSVNPTHDLTPEQEEEREKSMKLPEPDWKPNPELSKKMRESLEHFKKTGKFSMSK